MLLVVATACACAQPVKTRHVAIEFTAVVVILKTVTESPILGYWGTKRGQVLTKVCIPPCVVEKSHGVEHNTGH